MLAFTNLFSRLKHLLQLLWAAPVTVPCFTLYVFPFWKLGWYRYVGKKGEAWVWVHVEESMPNWLKNLWKEWAGQACGNCIVLKRVPGSSPRADSTLVHEQEHTRQAMSWGPLQPVMYVLSSLAAWMAGENHYRANHFEIAARRAAGQKIGLE